MTPKLFVTIAIKGAVPGGAICNYYRYNGNSVCTLCTGIGILCILLSFLSTALR
jgi:hypothetical protein